MFKRKELGVLPWMLLIAILSVPILNLIFLIWGFVTNRFSKSVQNFIIAFMIMYYVFGVSLFSRGLL